MSISKIFPSLILSYHTAYIASPNTTESRRTGFCTSIKDYPQVHPKPHLSRQRVSQVPIPIFFFCPSNVAIQQPTSVFDLKFLLNPCLYEHKLAEEFLYLQKHE